MTTVIRCPDCTSGSAKLTPSTRSTCRSKPARYTALGPNGAGKSTTVRVLLGLLRADAGQIRLLHGDPWRDTATLHRRIAYVSGRILGRTSPAER